MIHTDWTPDQYQKHDESNPLMLRSTRLHKLADPYAEAFGPQEDPSSFMGHGTLIDVLWLTPERENKEIIVKPENAPRRPSVTSMAAIKKGTAKPDTVKAANWWKNFDRKAMGKTVASEADMEHAKQLVRILNDHSLTSEIHKVSTKQVPVTSKIKYFDQTYPCKALLDLLPANDSPWPRTIFDLKKFSVISNRDIERWIARYEYHIQGGFHLDVFNTGTDDTVPFRDDFCLIIIHWDTGQVKVKRIKPQALELARQRIRERIAKWEEFRALDKPWFNWNATIEDIDLPGWEYKNAIQEGVWEPDDTDGPLEDIPT